MTDALDVAKLTILNSPDIHAWPATAQITRLELTPQGVRVRFTKQDGPDRWPDVPFGKPGDTLQYTLWIVLFIASSYWAAGCIEYWHGLDLNGGPPEEYAKNWYYDPVRWTPMTGHQPVPGEMVGFLVTSGDARHGGANVGLEERSNIVLVPFPGAAGAAYDFPTDTPAPAPAPAPEPAPAPAPAPAPEPAPAPAPARDPAERLARIELDLIALSRDIATTWRRQINVADILRRVAAELDGGPAA